MKNEIDRKQRSVYVDFSHGRKLLEVDPLVRGIPVFDISIGPLNTCDYLPTARSDLMKKRRKGYMHAEIARSGHPWGGERMNGACERGNCTYDD